jgi:hypothetical protein
MKATRQQKSSCLVIGMTSISFTLQKEAPAILHLIHSTISKSVKVISPQFVAGKITS